MEFQRIAILVLGMHRSGTSAFAGMLAKLGATPPKTIMPPTADNPLGYWESLEFEKFHGKLLASAGTRWHEWELLNPNWFNSHEAKNFAAELQNLVKQEFGNASSFIIKDPRICRFLPFWLEQLENLKITPKLVITLRNPLEVAASLEKRDGISFTDALLIWLRHMLDAEIASRNIPRSIIQYEELLFDWRSVLEKVSSELDLHWPKMSGAVINEIESYVTRSYRHHIITQQQLLLHKGVSQWVKIVYPIFIAISGSGPVDMGVFKELDRVKKEFDAACNVFRPLIAESEASRDLLKIKMDADNWVLTQDITNKDNAIAGLINSSIDQEKTNTELMNFLSGREATIAEQTKIIENIEAKLIQQTNLINDQSLKLVEQTKTIQNITEKIAEQNGTIHCRDAMITELTGRIANQDTMLAEKEKIIEASAAKTGAQIFINDKLELKLAEVTRKSDSQETKIIDLLEVIANGQSQIAELTFRNSVASQRLQELLNSLSWRATGPIRYIVSKFSRLS